MHMHITLQPQADPVPGPGVVAISGSPWARNVEEALFSLKRCGLWRIGSEIDERHFRFVRTPGNHISVVRTGTAPWDARRFSPCAWIGRGCGLPRSTRSR